MYDFFGWTVAAQLFKVADSAFLLSRLFDPLRKLNTLLLEQYDDTVTWLCAVIEEVLCTLFVKHNSLAVRVVCTEQSNYFATGRGPATVLYDNAELCVTFTACTLQTNNEHCL